MDVQSIYDDNICNVADYISLSDTPNSANTDQVKTPSKEVHCIDQHPNSGDIDICALHEGMVFDTEEDAMVAYNQYAYHKGFGIRKGSCYRSWKSKKITRQEFTCCKEGIPKASATPNKDAQSIRTGCKSKMRIRKNEDGMWEVTMFHDVHNHELMHSPSKTRFLRSHRKITVEDKEFIRTLHEQNISTQQIMGAISQLHGGIRNVSFTRKDLSNLRSNLRKQLFNIDLQTTVSHFRTLQAENPTFFYAIQLDTDNSVQNIFWIDGRSRMSYQYFGDVVTFDTTYMTNKYSMPFAPFVGVNHHMQSMLFGCALVRDECTESFVWVFQSFLEAMYGKHPKCILTDQDPAMKKAIELVFPNTVHRFCKWHILKNIRERLSVLFNTKEGLKENLHHCINTSISPEQFEHRWDAFIKKYSLESNTYLEHLFSIRDQWVPAYFRHIFFASMSTTQHSESINSLFKDYVDNHMNTFKFVTQYEAILESRYDREDEEDFRTYHVQPTLWSNYPIEKHALEVYTRSIFKIFREQLKLTTMYDIEEVEKYKLYHIMEIDALNGNQNKRTPYCVTCIISDDRFSCSCLMFEFSGVLCAHILKVLILLRIHSIPGHYILKRWTKQAKEGGVHIAQIIAEGQEDTTSRTTRFNGLCKKLLQLAYYGCTFCETYDLVVNDMESIIVKVCTLKKNLLEEQSASDERHRTQFPIDITQALTQCSVIEKLSDDIAALKDPPVSNCNGRKKLSRFKHPMEVASKKQRTCKKCHQRGHNIRTCKAKVDDFEAFISDDSAEEDHLDGNNSSLLS